MSVFEDFFGPELRAPDGSSVPTATRLADVEAIGIYFSAHWCPPCRGFTPKLAEIYKTMTGKGLKFDIVFVSSDKDEGQFNEYANEMPWASLPFSQRDTKGKLSKQYKVSGIPTLVIVDKNGKTITKDGRSAVTEDPEGNKFPWAPPTFQEALGESFVKPDGTAVGREAIAGKVLGLYFSAHWCPPCKAFTPAFASVYKEAMSKNHNFEVVFVSSDRDETSFADYHKEMPWLAVPYADRARKDALSKLFEVEGIPTLVIVDADSGEVINPNARGSISDDKLAEKFPWAPPPVCSLESPDGINETASLVVFAGSADKGVQDTIEAQLTTVAVKTKEEAKASGADVPYLFLMSRDNDGGVTGRVQKLTGTDASSGVKVVLLDIPDNGGYYDIAVNTADEITSQWVTDTLAKHKAGELTRKQLQS